MAGNKKKTAFFCQECGFESAKWTGQCPSCKAWNSMVEEPVRITAEDGAAGAQGGTFFCSIQGLPWARQPA